MNRLLVTFSVCFSTFLGALLLSNSAHAMKIAVSLPPLAGIIAPLLGEDDSIEVILKSGRSPHAFHLKPSHLRMLEKSDIAVTAGFGVDAWLDKALNTYKGTHINMADISTMRLYSVRKGGVWESVAPHKHTEVDSLDSGIDPHLWTAASNALELVIAVSDEMIRLAPEQKEAISERRDSWLARIKRVDHEVFMALNPVNRTPYIVLHDAFQYFEKRYMMTSAGSISLNPEQTPSLKRVFALRERIEKSNIRCVFKEPQFSSKRVQPVVEDLNVRIGELDPMGTTYSDERSGPGYVLYDVFLKRNAMQFVGCLTIDKVL